MKDCCTINPDLLHLMDKPSVYTHVCPICGAPGKLDRHHIVKRSQGKWVENGKEHVKPTITLCHSCHITVLHSQHRLYFDWDGGWVYLLLSKRDYVNALADHPEWGGKIGYANARKLSGWRRLINE